MTPLPSGLTHREDAVVELVSRGFGLREIARQLQLTERQVTRSRTGPGRSSAPRTRPSSCALDGIGRPAVNRLPAAERLALTVEEAASLLGVSRSGMYQVIRRPDGPPWVRVGNVIRIPRRGLEAWLEERTRHGPAA
jgi:excisionase family DNA binding protein